MSEKKNGKANGKEKKDEKNSKLQVSIQIDDELKNLLQEEIDLFDKEHGVLLGRGVIAKKVLTQTLRENKKKRETESENIIEETEVIV